MSDAAFREALEDYAQERISQVTCGGPRCESAHKILVAESEARVLALYAERENDHLAALEQVALATIRMEQGRAERQGECPNCKASREENKQ